MPPPESKNLVVLMTDSNHRDPVPYHIKIAEYIPLNSESFLKGNSFEEYEISESAVYKAGSRDIVKNGRDSIKNDQKNVAEASRSRKNDNSVKSKEILFKSEALEIPGVTDTASSKSDHLMGCGGAGGGGAGGGGRRRSSASRTAVIPPTKGKFYSIPKTLLTVKDDADTAVASFGYGVIHLYREVEKPTHETSLDVGVMKSHNDHDTQEHHHLDLENDSNSTALQNVVAILAVPSYMTSSDFLGFIGEEYSRSVSHFRMIRTAAPNRYMVLLKFRERAQALKFLKEYNGKSFNSMEPETCHVCVIKNVTFESSTSAPSEFPFIDSINLDSDGLQSMGKEIVGLNLKPKAPPTPSLLELPTCPVCLERMDAKVTGLLTILCQHTFHCDCLSKWVDGSCPVCRYSQRSDILKQRVGGHKCISCGSHSNLWICMVCGNIGCGRYDEAHAYQHYDVTGHAFAMDLETSRVWDYIGDEYVHRLVQNKTDGKLVGFPSVTENEGLSEANHEYMQQEEMADKVNELGLQYTCLISSQLDSQRMYFEDLIQTSSDRAKNAIRKSEVFEKSLEILKRDFESSQARLAELEEQSRKLEISNNVSLKRAEKLTQLVKQLQDQNRQELSLNAGLIERNKYNEKQLLEKDDQIADLEGQLRDVIFAMEMRDRKDLEGGLVVTNALGNK